MKTVDAESSWPLFTGGMGGEEEGMLERLAEASTRHGQKPCRMGVLPADFHWLQIPDVSEPSRKLPTHPPWDL